MYNPYQQAHYSVLYQKPKRKPRDPKAPVKHYNLVQAGGIILNDQPYGICASAKQKAIARGVPKYLLKIEPVNKK